MGQKRYTAEQIIGKLRQARVRSAAGKCVAAVVTGLARESVLAAIGGVEDCADTTKSADASTQPQY